MAFSFADELAGADFGDKRLDDRVVRILENLSKKPNMSIPAASFNHAEMTATYRFCDNAKVTPEGIAQPHVESTKQRIRESDVVLLVQDTTELDLTRPSQQVQGVGPLDCETRFGIHYHPLMAFTPERLCLGTVWSTSWARESLDKERTKKEKEKARRAIPIEEKESLRWVEGIRAARSIAEACPTTQCVCVCDSEADIFEVLAEPRKYLGGELHLLIRACQDRALIDQEGCLLKAVRKTECLGRNSLTVSSRKPKIEIKKSKRQQARDARVAQVEVRAKTVTLGPPPRPDRKLPPVTINVVLVEEVDAPKGTAPIQWVLLTTLPIDTAQQVQTIVDYYCARWQIEVYFRTLKSGCRVEERYFERLGRLSNCLAIYAITAWQILYLCQLSRECPDLCCEVVFHPSEWKSVYMTVKRKAAPKIPPSLNTIVRIIASLGGYVIRKKTRPGTQTLWLGLQRLNDLAMAWEAFGPPAQTKNFASGLV